MSDPRFTDATTNREHQLIALWQAQLPPEAVAAGFTVSFCNGLAFDRAWFETADGVRHELDLAQPLFDAISRARHAENIPGRGTWTTLSAESRVVDGVGRTSLSRDERRTWWGTHPGAPWQPPASGAAKPTDEQWHDEFVRGQQRDPEHLPDWVVGDLEPPLDPNAPLPEGLAAWAAHPPMDAWIDAVGDALQQFTKDMGGQIADFRADPHSIEGDSIRGIVLENVPFDVRDQVLFQRDGAELRPVWQTMTGRTWPADVPEPNTRQTIAEWQASVLDLARQGRTPVTDAQVGVLNDVDEGIDRIVSELMESRIRR